MFRARCENRMITAWSDRPESFKRSVRLVGWALAHQFEMVGRSPTLPEQNFCTFLQEAGQEAPYAVPENDPPPSRPLRRPPPKAPHQLTCGRLVYCSPPRRRAAKSITCPAINCHTRKPKKNAPFSLGQTIITVPPDSPRLYMIFYYNIKI